MIYALVCLTPELMLSSHHRLAGLEGEDQRDNFLEICFGGTTLRKMKEGNECIFLKFTHIYQFQWQRSCSGTCGNLSSRSPGKAVDQLSC